MHPTNLAGSPIPRERHHAGLADALAMIERYAMQVAGNPSSPPVLDSLRHEVHRLYALSANESLADAARLAAAFEERLAQWRDDPSAEPGERGRIAGHFVHAFRAAAFGTTDDVQGATRGVVLLVEIDDGAARAIEAEVLLRGFTPQRAPFAGLSARAVLDIAPRALVLPSVLVPVLPNGLGAPVVALRDADAGPPRRRTRALDVPIVSVDTGEPASVLLDVVEQMVTRGEQGGATLLVVDDDAAVLDIVREIAEQDGLRVVTLDAAGALLEALERESPAMLLMDVQMGSANGIEATRRLRRVPRYRELPVALISDRADAVTRDRAFRAGADDFIAKPLVPLEVRQCVRAALERRRLRRAADGLHPVLDLTLSERTVRDAARAWSNNAARTIAVLQPAMPVELAAWTTEAARLVAHLKPHARTIGFDSAGALLAVFDADAGPTTMLVEALWESCAGASPAWHAGIAGVDDAGRPFARARTAAFHAAELARDRGVAGVHRWTLADDTMAPDVIIVDDDTAFSEMVQYALRIEGFTFQAFADGQSAYEALDAMRFEKRHPVILLDVDIPGMDGHTLHERLRVERPGAFAVVFLSVQTGEGDQVRALHAGAWDYIAKPVNLRVLMAKLPLWIARGGTSR